MVLCDVLDRLLMLSELIVFAATHPSDVEWLLGRGSIKTEKEGWKAEEYVSV